MESAAGPATAIFGRSACLALLIIAGTACGPPSADALYRRADQLRRTDALKQALAAAEEGFRREPSWRFRLLRADLLISSRNAQQALKVLSSPEESMTPEQRARLAMHRGTARYLLGDYAAAEADLQAARDLARPVRSPLLDAEIELRRGPLEVREGHLLDAETSLREALRLAAAEGDDYLQGAAIGNLGVMYMTSSRFDEAIYWLQRAETAFERLHSSGGVTRAMGNLGWCYHRLGDEARALAYLRQAEARSKQAANRSGQQIWLGNMGDVFLIQENYAAASAAFKEALAIARDLGDKYYVASWLNDLATVSINLGDFDSAARYNAEALEMFRKMPGNETGYYPRVNEAQIAAGRKDFDTAERLYRALLAAPSTDPTPMLEAESGLATLLVEKGDMPRAAAEFRAAIALIERQRSGLKQDESKLSYLSSLIRFYQRYVDFLVARGEPEMALEVAEASRARLLDERVGGARERGIDLTALKSAARASGGELLFYWLAPERSFLWTIAGDKIALHVLPPDKQIAALVDGYRTFIENLRDPLASEIPEGRRLAEMLLGQVDAARILIVPDRALHSLNFETLPDPKDPAHYLIDRVTVQVAPSLGVLLEPRKSPPAARSLLLIGDPEQEVEEYPRLPNAGQEMELISRDLPANQRVVLEGAGAYPAAYREAVPSRFSWIHFAAHAAANRESPLDSALILSRRDKGYTLAARDVMNIPLTADLVTLSACRSAGSKTYSGEGLVGLAWAFLRAGARNVVAGLWDVTDLSTATLMSDFYRELVRGATPADALRAAKLRIIHSRSAYRKPFYWGPFQLYTGGITPTSAARP